MAREAEKIFKRAVVARDAGQLLAGLGLAGGDPAAGFTLAAAELCAQARGLMQQGAPLARRIPGRAGWELRLVIQGGLLILDKIAALQHRSWQQRPRVGAADVPRLVWRALCMR